MYDIYIYIHATTYYFWCFDQCLEGVELIVSPPIMFLDDAWHRHFRPFCSAIRQTHSFRGANHLEYAVGNGWCVQPLCIVWYCLVMLVQSQSNICKHETIMKHLCLICLMCIIWALVWIIFEYGRAVQSVDIHTEPVIVRYELEWYHWKQSRSFRLT